jgi:hypothetical protein
MYHEVNSPHHEPHLHAWYSGEQVVVDFDGKVLGGSIQSSKMKLLLAWIEIHKEELVADWELLSKGEQFFKIAPLQ